jgi:hypothetical protein
MQLPQKCQAGRGLPFEQHQNERKTLGVRPPVERLVIFEHLPRAEARLPDQQDESCGVRDFLGKLRRPETARPVVQG